MPAVLKVNYRRGIPQQIGLPLSGVASFNAQTAQLFYSTSGLYFWTGAAFGGFISTAVGSGNVAYVSASGT